MESSLFWSSSFNLESSVCFALRVASFSILDFSNEEIFEEDEVILPIKKPAKMEMMHIIITDRYVRSVKLYEHCPSRP